MYIPLIEISCDDWKTLFFIQISRYPEVWYNRHVAAFFEKIVLKEVRVYACYLHNNITMLLIAEVQNEASNS